MKKITAILLSVLMLVSVSAVSINAFAVVESQETTKTSSKITVEVNGTTSKDVTYKADPDDPAKITFKYNGNGTLEGWEFDGMVEGVDYQVVSEDGKSITIELLNGFDGDITANAIVKGGKKGSGKGSGKGKSPKTGAAATTGLAAAGAGAAILLAMRKKEDAE
ncbi:MAG: hypothetical protein IKR97_01005 [Eubacterium sp.]|nr:hypothetical protein [Eubacterium sp.]